jgi:hypothetical protein
MLRLLNTLKPNIFNSKKSSLVCSKKINQKFCRNSIKTITNSNNSTDKDQKQESQGLCENTEDSISTIIQEHMQHEHEVKINCKYN